MARKSRRNKNVEAASNQIIENCENLIDTGAYIRLSVENGGNETDETLVVQQMLVEKFIEEHPDLKLAGTYIDNGFSGTNFERPGFLKLMEDVRSGKIQCIVVKDLSRFGRDYLETGYYLETILTRLNVRFIAITDDYDSSRKEDRENISVPLKNMVNATKMPFKADKTVDDDYFILTLYALAMEARNKGITLTGKDVVLGVGLPPADYGQQATSFKKYFLDHAKHGISFKMNGKSVNFYLKDVFVSPQNFAAVMCFKASLLKKYRTVNCIDIGDGTVDLLVIRNGKPDLSVRVSDRSGMAVLRSEISNAIQQNYGIHLDSSDVEQVLMQEETILDEEIIQKAK